MKREELIFVGTCDLAGLVRGKGFPAADLPARLRKGVGLTHSNIMMSAFGPIYETPFGTEGDLMLVPDPAPRSRSSFGEYSAAERFYLGDIHDHRRGEPWECCPRAFPAPRARGAEPGRGRRPEGARRVRAGIRLYRRRAPARRDLLARRASPPGPVRRSLHGGDARRRARAGQFPAGIRRRGNTR